MAVTDEAIKKIKAMIVSGELGPGDRLPKESALAADLGLSRTSLREAVKALSLINVLDVRQGDGTYVTSLEPALLSETLDFVIDFHRDEQVREILAVRRILEPQAAALAAGRLDADQLAVLTDLVDDLADELRSRADLGALVANDLEFHRVVGAACGNSMLSALVETLSGPSTRARVWRALLEADAGPRALAERRAVLAALAAGDAEAAGSAAATHLASVQEWLARAP